MKVIIITLCLLVARDLLKLFFKKKPKEKKKQSPPKFHYTLTDEEMSFTTVCRNGQKVSELRQDIDMYHVAGFPDRAARKAKELSQELKTDQYHTSIITGYYVKAK